MELIAKERDRLLGRAARYVGLAGTVVSLVSVSLPGILPLPLYLATLPLFALLLASHVMLGRGSSLPWVTVGVLSGLVILGVAALAPETPGLAAAFAPLAAAGIAGFSLVLVPTMMRVAVFVATALVCTILIQQLSDTDEAFSATASSVLLGWGLTLILAYWMSASVPRAARRIYSIGRAHRAERQASETEAQRRQSARLLHDTVLATLTLLAHSGVGVAPEALRQQAADDARLLRQLRLGATPTPQSSGSYNLEPVEETVLGTTLESVKQRFGRMGLEVTWHGTGQVLLPSDVLDAFLLSLAECLENVRRHSGVTQAHVTITDDPTTVRAMVTDSGVGFELAGIDEDKLGFKESVVGRLREVGGTARLFSSPGAGTTVILSVPK